MFLTIGEKIRQARQQYSLKQVSFESFGFSRNYISMLETNKRFLNEELLKNMYDALVELTDGAFKKDYTYEQFILPPKEQAKVWLEEHCTLEYGLSNYETYNEVATTYELFEPLIELNEMIALHYHLLRDHQKSNDYHLKAIIYCNQMSINPGKYYNCVGVNFGQLGQYKDAIAQYKIAMNLLSDTDDVAIKYKNLYDLSSAYLYDNEYDQCVFYTDELMLQNDDLKVKASSYLLKAMIFQRQNQYEDAKEVLMEFIDNPFYLPVLGHAYHNLAYVEYTIGHFENALKALELSAKYRDDYSKDKLTNSQNNVTNSLVGEIHYRLKNYNEAKSIFNNIKRDVFTASHMNQKEDFITWGLQLYLDLKEFDYIVALFKEVKDFIRQGLVSQSTYLLMEKQLYKNIIDEALDNKDAILEYEPLMKLLK